MFGAEPICSVLKLFSFGELDPYKGSRDELLNFWALQAKNLNSLMTQGGILQCYLNSLLTRDRTLQLHSEVHRLWEALTKSIIPLVPFLNHVVLETSIEFN